MNGIGLHSGKKVKLKFIPAAVDTGIIFKRVDLKGYPVIKAVVDNVISTNRSTTIGNGELKIQTIEHLMAAFRAYNIDNIIVEIDSKELPALDGSAIIYSEILNKAGIKQQNKKRKVLKINKSFHIKNQDTYLGIFPSDVFKVSYLLKYDHPKVGTEFFEYTFDKKSFIKEIMPARTFGFESEIKKLKSQGLALGGSLQNAILLKEDSIVNELRFEDEFVRHKILDLIGDLYLNGPIVAEVIAIRTGHQDNHKINQLIQKMKN